MSAASKPVPLQLAAGGLVWRNGSGEPTLAVVHRPKFDDWTLPKGGVETGETLDQTARREVREETGVEPELGEVAGTLHFDHDGATELVVFWHMRAADGVDSFMPSGEVDQILWLTREQAQAKLSYPGERALLDDTPPAAAPATQQRIGRLSRFWRATLDPSGARLAEVLPVAGLELSESDEAKRGGAWQLALQEARDASERGDTEAGWQCLKLANREWLLVCDDADFEARAAALRAEVEDKLWGWRGGAATKLLTLADKCDPQPSDRQRRLVYNAARILDEASDNVYRSLSLSRRNRTLLLPVLLTAIVAIVALVALDWVDLQPAPSDDSAGFLTAVALFGVIGASLSAIQTLGGKGRGAQRIPDAMASAVMTLARPAVGAGAALGAYALVRAEFLKIEITSGYVLLAIAFAAGFSERFVFSLVDSATGERSSTPG